MALKIFEVLKEIDVLINPSSVEDCHRLPPNRLLSGY